MGSNAPGDITQYLARLSKGDQSASAALMPLLYDELRALAGSFFRQENMGHTLQPTALVHEAYLRMIGQADAQWKNRAHFLAVAAQVIRRVLIDHARMRRADKRTPPTRIMLDDASGDPRLDNAADLEALDVAMTRLAALNERQSRVVEMRFFAGMTVEETAQVLSVSANTVKGDWRVARAWLQLELEREGLA